MGPRPQVKRVTVDDLRIEVLPEETLEAFRAATEFAFLEDGWYLAGGTALALQVGHRQSFDLDFFTEQKSFNTEDLARTLVAKSDWVTTNESAGTLYGILRGAQMSLIAYPFFRPRRAYVQCGTLRMLTPDDIAAMKIIALSQRGKKRDFVDLYWFAAIRGTPLTEILQSAITQYPEQEHSVPHFIKSLTYFEDAEDDPMPRLHFEAEWEGIKEYFRREVPLIAEDLLDLK